MMCSISLQRIQSPLSRNPNFCNILNSTNTPDICQTSDERAGEVVTLPSQLVLSITYICQNINHQFLTKGTVCIDKISYGF